MIKNDINELRDEILRKHTEFGHAGTYKLYKTLKMNNHDNNYSKSEIQSIIKYCKVCQFYKNTKNYKGKTVTYRIASRKNEMLSSDIVGPFTYKENQKDYKYFIMTLTDHFSRYTKLYKIKYINSLTIIDKIKKWIAKFGKPQIFLSDNGTCYASKSTRQFLEKNNIKISNSSPYNPMSNGVSERLNQLIKLYSRIFQNKLRKKEIKEMEKGLNETYHKTIDEIPRNIFLNEINEQTRENIYQRTLKSSELNMKKINKRIKEYNYEIGDEVLKRKTYNNKFKKWDGPYKVTKVIQNIVEIDGANTKEITSIRNVKPYFNIELGETVRTSDISDNINFRNF